MTSAEVGRWIRVHYLDRVVVVTAEVHSEPEGQFSTHLSPPGLGTFHDPARYLMLDAAQFGADALVRLRYTHRCNDDCDRWTEA